VFAEQIAEKGDFIVAKALSRNGIKFWDWMDSEGETVFDYVLSQAKSNDEDRQLFIDVLDIILKSSKKEKEKNHSAKNLIKEAIKDGYFPELVALFIRHELYPDIWQDRCDADVLAYLIRFSAYARDRESRPIYLEKFKQFVGENMKKLSDESWRRKIASVLMQGCREASKFLLNLKVAYWSWKDDRNLTVLEKLCFNSEYGETLEERANCLELFKEGINSPRTDLTKDDDFRKGIADSFGCGCKEALKFLSPKCLKVWQWKNLRGASVLAMLCVNSEYGLTQEKKRNCLELFKEGINSPQTDLTKDDDFRKDIADSLGRGCKDAFKLLDQNKDVWQWKNCRGESVLEKLCFNSEYGLTQEKRANCLELFKEGIKSTEKDLTADDDFRQGIADSLGYGCKEALKLLDQNKDVWQWKDRAGKSVLARLCDYSEYGETRKKRFNCLEAFKHGIDSSEKDLTKDDAFRQGVANALNRGCKSALNFLSRKVTNVWEWQDSEGDSVLASLCYYAEYGETKAIRANCSQIITNEKASKVFKQDKKLQQGVADLLGLGCASALEFLKRLDPEVWKWKNKEGYSVLELLCHRSEYGDSAAIRANCWKVFATEETLQLLADNEELQRDVADFLGVGCKKALEFLDEKDTEVWKWKNKEGCSVLELLCYRSEYDTTEERKGNCLNMFKIGVEKLYDQLKTTLDLRNDLAGVLVNGCPAAVEVLLEKNLDVWRWKFNNKPVLQRLVEKANEEQNKIKAPAVESIRRIVAFHNKSIDKTLLLNQNEIDLIRRCSSQRVRSLANLIKKKK
jgi:hypothetical protein